MNRIRQRIEEKNFYSKKLIPPFPKKNMLIEVTNYCNHKCIFCANSKMTRPRGFIEPEFANRILREAYDLGTREVGFYAMGEPFINNRIFEYIKTANHIGYDYIYVTTNGSLLDEAKMNQVVQSGLDSIKFSINAGTRETYTKIHGADDFGKVINNIKCLSNLRKKNKIKLAIYVSCVVTSLTINEKNLLQDLLKNDVDDIVFIDVGNQGGLMYEESNSLKVGETFLARGSCEMPFNSLTITYEGYLSACCVDFQNYLIIADLNKVSLKEAWESPLFQKLRKMHIEKSFGNTVCNNCIFGRNDEVLPLQI